MFIRLFYTLRKYGVPVTTQELLDLNQAIEKNLVFADLEQFYWLVRMLMVKDERYFDKFDRAFKAYMDGVEHLTQEEILRLSLIVAPQINLSKLKRLEIYCNNLAKLPDGFDRFSDLTEVEINSDVLDYDTLPENIQKIM